MSDNGWHLKKEVSVGHIITTATIFVSAVAYVISVETRFKEAEMRDLQIVERMDRVDAWQQAEFAEVKTFLRRIEDKLDRKADQL